MRGRIFVSAPETSNTTLIHLQSAKFHLGMSKVRSLNLTICLQREHNACRREDETAWASSHYLGRKHPWGDRRDPGEPQVCRYGVSGPGAGLSAARLPPPARPGPQVAGGRRQIAGSVGPGDKVCRGRGLVNTASSRRPWTNTPSPPVVSIPRRPLSPSPGVTQPGNGRT